MADIQESRKILSLEDLEQVTGGTLHVKTTADGVTTLYQKDLDGNIIGAYAVNVTHEALMQELQSTYWGLERGKRDEQMLAILKAKKMIK